MATNPIAANLLLVIVLIAGYIAIGGIRKEVFPSFPTDTFTVTVPYPGSSPVEVEQGIVLKLEEELRDIIGVKEIRSAAMEGVAVITVEMEAGSDIAKALNQAKVRVDGIRSFPLDAEEPIVEEVISRGFAMRVSLYGNIDENGLKQLTDQVREEILELEGISEIRMLGERSYQLSIEVSTASLRRYGLDFDQVVNAVRNRSRDLPGGTVRTADGAIKLRSVSQAYSGEEFSSLTLLTRDDGTRIKLGDIAQVIDGFEDQPVLSTLNGRRAVTLTIDRVGNQDVLKMTTRLRNYIAEKQASLADGVHIVGWIDESNILRGRIELMLRNAAQGAVLVVLALALFLNVTLALWVIVGVPFAVMATLATIYFLNLPISINVLSVFAFILVLGILVDDGIVTAESAYARLESERQGVASVVRGVRRVAMATIFGALTTMIAFSPTLLLTEGFARVMTHIGPVVILCVFFSLIETKLILPAHLRHIRIGVEASSGWRRSIDRVQGCCSSALKNFASGPYRRLLQLSLNHRYTTLSVFLAVLIICLALVPAGLVRFVFFPNVPSDQIMVKLEMPQGTPWQTTHDYARRIESAAQAMNERYLVSLDTTVDVIRQLMVVSESDTSARVDLDLVPSEERTISSVVLAQWLREELGTLEGARAISIDAVAGPPGSALEVQLSGKSLESLRMAAVDLKRSLALMEGVQDISDSFNAGGRELDIHVTPEGEVLGLGDVELARQVRQAFFGAEVQRVQRGRHEVRVYVRLPAADRARIDSLQALWIRLPDGRKVPFSVVGEARELIGLSVINRTDRKRVVNVQADINKRLVEPGEVTRLLERDVLPRLLEQYPDIEYHFGGQAEDEQDTSSVLGYAITMVLLIIFAALAIPLKSYIEPLLIMSVIPFGIIGAIIGHLVLGKDLSILSVIGIVGLVGVVVNDSLVMVDFINHYIDEGHDWCSAVMEAGPMRFRAVILTSLTTFLGLLPIQLETSIQSEFVKPMAISVAFGVLFATFVTLILVPVLYFIAKDVERLVKSL
ncbi:MAG: AcrB/AcrD/AcrF family protein [Gammaproteobacteria bacterium]|nr:MAG: AcrB/AcrD/AcrF family protein [Gammaproteobacteria bacterium]RLA58396.1 MAG: AcrB/AcrD/AcrF family protein [Gammaproteobacteria bacterium]